MLLLNKYLRIGKQLIVFLFLFKNVVISQNLIRNGSFENYHMPMSCVLWGGDFIGYYTWPPDTVMIDWKGYQTPDFFISACTYTYSGVPINYVGYSYAKEGSNYVGFLAYARGGYDKEYIYQQLSQPLQAGKVYCLSFFVSKADRVPYAIHSIGALLSNSLQPVTNGYEINAIPQVVNQNGFIADTIQWVEISGCFTANGGERYITIGNFTTNFNTDTLNINSINIAAGKETTSYYYIDGITLVEQTATSVAEVKRQNLKEIKVYPNPTEDKLKIISQNLKDIENLKIKIVDVLGREIKQIAYEEEIDVSELESGVYFIQIGNYTQKFIKE